MEMLSERDKYRDEKETMIIVDSFYPPPLYKETKSPTENEYR